MSEKLKNNPFSQLFESLEEAGRYAESCKAKLNEKQAATMTESSHNVNINISDKIERIFGITLDKKTKNQLVYLEDVAIASKQQLLDLEILEQALFERLLIEEPNECLLNPNNPNRVPHVAEKKAITYLYQCYTSLANIVRIRGKSNDLQVMQDLIMRNVATALKQPVLYSSQDVFEQLEEIIEEENSQFFKDLVTEVEKDEDEGITETAFVPLLSRLHLKLLKATLGTFSITKTCNCLLNIAGSKLTANILMDYSTPKDLKSGSDFERTLLGSLLKITCLPRNDDFLLEDYFLKNCSISVNYQKETETIWSFIADIHKSVYSVFYQLLKISPDVNRKLISWISKCLKENKTLGNLWRSYAPQDRVRGDTVSIGFMINLGSVLLLLCEPIITDKTDQKIMKIDPTYGATTDFAEETCLISVENRPVLETYNFVTEIFFLTHKSVDLGFRVCSELFLQAAQDMSSLFAARRDARATGFQEAADATEERINRQKTVMQSYYAAIFEPRARELLLKLNAATSKWVVQVLLDVETEGRTNYQITKKRELVFPLLEQIPDTLACIPEFFIENTNWNLSLLTKVKEDLVNLNDLEVMTPIVTMIIVLTRGKNRVKNPHLRAGLIACLECLVPKTDDKKVFVSTEIFEVHPHVTEIIPSLLDVFVSIEMTGESVQFEQKFNYRHPIYVLIELLWSFKVHRNCFKALAAEAEQNMEAVSPPIFLRFLNLLINDAVFLLDEALSNMAQLKNMERVQESEEYTRMSARERQQADALFRHTGMIARFDNILGKRTIQTLQFLTSEIKSIISHPTMVDRVASMLNYFLHNLVGPNKKNLAVKDKQEYDFNPGEIVLIISQIYANLAKCDAFCLAISQDGRSYNPKLFIEAELVLCRIGGSHLVPEIRDVAARAAQMASKQKIHEELMADAPEEFFDPIMSTIMTDPVILPTSHVTVDRATIARHLLSDQTDPFNRTPLSMDNVKPNDELRLKIQNWIEERSKKE